MCNCNENIIEYIDQELEEAKNKLNNAFASDGGQITKENAENFFRGKIEALAAVRKMLEAKRKSKNKNKTHLPSYNS
tara:strand:- start:910 stop:1140 length:231 start_codon:yes stop_codon:yes gene_type:complete